MAKYLRKKEFRYDDNPALKNKKGKGHTAYVTVEHGERAKINLITHSKKPFFGKGTEELSRSPRIGDKDPRPSRVSVPYWEEKKFLKKKPYGKWRLPKKDRILIEKINRKAAKDERKEK